jgi:hypothetical protein
MPSQLKSSTARTNGAKSQGPTTPEGRAKSSTNSIRHGLTAKSIVLPNESAGEFQFLLDSHVDQFRPQTQVEMGLVETMAVARWRLRRIQLIETTLLTTETVHRAEVTGRQFADVDADARLAAVFQKLANTGPGLALLVRYEGTLNRSYDRAFKHLQVLQSVRNRPQPNEPKPDPTPLTVTTDSPSPTPPSDPARLADAASLRRNQTSSKLSPAENVPS